MLYEFETKHCCIGLFLSFFYTKPESFFYSKFKCFFLKLNLTSADQEGCQVPVSTRYAWTADVPGLIEPYRNILHLV